MSASLSLEEPITRSSDLNKFSLRKIITPNWPNDHTWNIWTILVTPLLLIIFLFFLQNVSFMKSEEVLEFEEAE